MKMGSEQTYSRSVFEAILGGLGVSDPFRGKYILDDQGARVDKDYCVDDLAWHPMCEIMALGSPNPLDEPWLPFPFEGRKLAALMVDGWGHFIREKYGKWDDGPAEAALLSIGPLGGKAKEAITVAYQAYRNAVKLAPQLDLELASIADALAHQYIREREAAMEREKLREPGIADAEYTYRLGRVNYAVAALDELLSEARKSADTAYSKWRWAVVQHLLLPVEQVDGAAFESQILQALPPERRAEAIAQIQSKHEFLDSEEGRAHWALLCERGDIDRDLLRWKSLSVDTPTDALIKEQKVVVLTNRLKEIAEAIDAAAPAPITQTGVANSRPGVPAPASAIAPQPDKTERQQQRLVDFGRLGGKWVKRGVKWGAKEKNGAFNLLVEQERHKGARNASEKSVRADLTAAAIIAEDERRAGIALPTIKVP